MPFMIFDRSKKALQFVDDADLFTGTKANLVSVISPDNKKSFQARNYSSVETTKDDNTRLDTNGPWDFGSYKLNFRAARAGQWDDDNGDGTLDPGEEYYTTGSYSGLGYYRFGIDSPVNVNANYDYDNAVSFFSVKDLNGDGDHIDGAKLSSTAWSMELVSVGYRSDMDIHAGRSGLPFNDRVTKGCIRITDESLEKLDTLHEFPAPTSSGRTAMTGLIVVDNVSYVAFRSTTTDKNVALVDAREFGVANSVANLSSGIGNDYLFGSDVNNVLKGNAGNDQLFGKGGHDTLYGGQGSDRLVGGTGDDKLYGGASSSDSTTSPDLLDGGRGNDELYGAAGHDLLVGQQGDDKIFGNDGDDLIFGDYVTKYEDIITTSEYKEIVYKIVDYGAGGAIVEINKSNIAHLVATDGKWTPDSGTDEKLALAFDVAHSGIDVIRGGKGHDTIYGGENNDDLYGDEGNDELIGGEGDDKLYGGDGKDILYGGKGADTLEGGAGTDQYFWLSDEDAKQDKIIEATGDFRSDLNYYDVLYFRQTTSSEINFTTRNVEGLYYIGNRALNLNINSPEVTSLHVGEFGSKVTLAKIAVSNFQDFDIFMGDGADVLRFATSAKGSFVVTHNFESGRDKIDLSLFAGGRSIIVNWNEDDDRPSGRYLDFDENGGQLYDYNESTNQYTSLVGFFGDAGSEFARSDFIL